MPKYFSFSFVNIIAVTNIDVTNSLGIGVGTNPVRQLGTQTPNIGTQIAQIRAKITTIDNFANIFRAKFTQLV